MTLHSLPSAGVFLDPAAIGIVFGGTVLAALLRTPLRDVARASAALRVLGRQPFDAAALLHQIEALSRISARHGVLQLDRSVIHDPDVAAGMACVVDGADGVHVAATVEHRRIARYERHRAAAAMWTSVAEIAPAMGMIGTLVGLIRMFTAMSDPASIGAAMAIALLTTLYGALLANLVAMPIASRLKRLARAEMIERGRLIVPLADLAQRELPRHHREERAA